MLKLGEKIISNIYLGDKKIAKVFLGDKLVYQANKPLFLEYVESTGTQYIDTGVPANVNTIVEYTFSLAQVPPSGALFGAGTSQSSTDRFQGYYESGTGFSSKLASTTTYANVFLTENTKHYSKVGIPLGGYYIDETFVSSATGTPSDFNLYIFGRNIAGRFLNPTSLRLYSFKISENETLIRDFRPCLDPKGTVCMYDMVTKKYFYNKGTGTLKADGKFVESIKFDRASYIDTGIVPTNETGAYCKLTLTGGDEVVLGSRNDFTTDTRLDLIAGFQTNIGFGRGIYLYLMKDGTISRDDIINNAVTVTLNTPLEIWSNYKNSRALRSKQNTIDVTGSPIKELDFVPLYSMFLGARNVQGAMTASCTNRVYQCQITEGNTVIQDLRPYVDSNGVACFKDVITGKTFYNQGTGTLTYTEVK